MKPDKLNQAESRKLNKQDSQVNRGVFSCFLIIAENMFSIA